ncbi:MAG: ATP-binding protein [Bryobacteraceae bacterium]
MTWIQRFLAFANEDYGLSKAEVTETMKTVYARGDRLMGFFVMSHILVAFIQAFAYDTWVISILVTLAAAGMFFSSAALLPGTLYTRFVAGIVLQAFCALHIYQLHGMPEMHFYFFTAQTMMIVYEDWKATWPGTWLIIGQHILFAILQNTGSTLYFFPDSYITVRKLTFHFGIALTQVGLCSYWAILQRRHRFQVTSQNKEIEASRAQAVLTARLSALGQMAASLAHEINTPLSIISASARNLVRLTDSGNLNTPDVLKHSDRITGTSDRIAKIVKSLRHIARDESEDAFRRVPACEIVEECLELCGERFRVNSVRLESSPVDPTILVSCREGQIAQVLLNLLTNAFDAVSSVEGQGWVKVDVHVEGGLVHFTVTDNGPGIAPELRTRIMEPFFTTKPVGTGIGLGLSLSRSLAENHSGTLALAEPAENTSFVLTLPLADSRDLE